MSSSGALLYESPATSKAQAYTAANVEAPFALQQRPHDDTLVLSDGQYGDWTPRDLRRTGATMMQALGVSLDVIDRCQTMCWPVRG